MMIATLALAQTYTTDVAQIETLDLEFLCDNSTILIQKSRALSPVLDSVILVMACKHCKPFLFSPNGACNKLGVPMFLV